MIIENGKLQMRKFVCMHAGRGLIPSTNFTNGGGPPGAPMADQWLELSQAVIRLNKSERDIRRRISEGKLDGAKRGGKWWVKIPNELTVLSTPKNPLPEEMPLVAKPAQSEGTRYRSDRYHRPKEKGTHSPDPCDHLDVCLGVGLIAPWRKLRQLQHHLTKPDDLAECNCALAILLEGFLGFGTHKIECYRLCRSATCRLAINLQATGASKDTIELVADAISAMQSLIITLSRTNKQNQRKEDEPQRHHA
jgi:hypothetical protein